MRAQTSIGLILLALAACTPRTQDRPASPAQTSAAPPVAIRIVAFNDFHGNLPPPRQYITAQTPTGPVKVPAGGGAYFASAIAKLKAENPLNIVVSAGDMTGASPLMSSLFLDEPTIEAMNLIGVDLNAAGNHEFDRGQDELKRLQTGGCAKFAAREPCQLSPKFPGASFQYLAANSVRQDGSTLFPPYAIRTFGEGKGAIKVGFIGTTLKGTAEIVSAAGIAGIHFADEAKTANALIPELRAKGADVIVVLVHEGGRVTAPHGAPSCAGLEGDILPVLDALDPAVDIVISGHTHREYVCDFGTVNPAKPFLLTSAGQYGTLVTSIDIAVDPLTRKLVSKHAENVIVQGEAYDGGTGRVDLTNAAPVYPADPRIKALIDRYSAASATFTQRVVGHATGAILRASTPSGEQAAGNLIADAQLAALRGPGGAQLAFMNQGGVRADILTEPDGSITFGSIYKAQPFNNMLTVKTFTGQQILDLLEQQFNDARETFRILLPSGNVRYSYDYRLPAGARVSGLTIDGKPVDRAAKYRVATSIFLGDGGDGLTVLKAGTDPYIGMLDLEALEFYLKANDPVSAPKTDRIRRIDAD